MKKFLSIIVSIIIVFFCIVMLLNLFSPGLGSKLMIKALPMSWVTPKAGDSDVAHIETPFLDEIKLIYGTFTVQDSCVIPYPTPYPFDYDDDNKLVVVQSATIEFIVDIDDSKIQVSDQSKTLVIDTTGLRLIYYPIKSKTNTFRHGDLSKVTDEDINLQIEKCNEVFQKNIDSSKELVTARQRLDKLLSSDYIYVVGSGKEE